MRLFLLIITGIYTTVTAAGSLRTTTTSSSTETSRVLQSNDFWITFANIRGNMVWPTPNSTASLISSTFGFRNKASCNCDDFHRGVDIHGNIGDRVLASYGGKVSKVGTYSTGNKYIVLEHTFASAVNFHGHAITKWYTHYFHLDKQLVQQGATVVAGEEIGKVGNTGVLTGNPHLHHEVLLGTRCSLEFALANPTSTCNTLGVDPHVHPFYIYPSNVISNAPLTITLQQNVTSSVDGRIRVKAPDHSADVNRYEVQIKNTSTGTIRKAHVLDYNLRIGYNASTVQQLDTADTTKPYLKPIAFGYTATEWNIDLIIPTAWVGGSKAANEVFVVTVTDIWQEATTLPQFGLGVAW